LLRNSGHGLLLLLQHVGLDLLHQLQGLLSRQALQGQRGGLRQVAGQQLLLLLEHRLARQGRVRVELELRRGCCAGGHSHTGRRLGGSGSCRHRCCCKGCLLRCRRGSRRGRLLASTWRCCYGR
jgi:hypothetical protein